jgi:hypothetical protein
VINNQVGSPDWLVPVIAGSFLLIGAILGFFFNWINDWRHAKREHRERWHDEVREFGALALAACNAVNQESQNQSALTDVADPSDQPHADSEFAASRVLEIQAYERLVLIHSGLSLIATREVSYALQHLVAAARTVTISNVDQSATSRDELSQRAHDFRAAVRNYLGVLPADSVNAVDG